MITNGQGIFNHIFLKYLTCFLEVDRASIFKVHIDGMIAQYQVGNSYVDTSVSWRSHKWWTSVVGHMWVPSLLELCRHYRGATQEFIVSSTQCKWGLQKIIFRIHISISYSNDEIWLEFEIRNLDFKISIFLTKFVRYILLNCHHFRCYDKSCKFSTLKYEIIKFDMFL